MKAVVFNGPGKVSVEDRPIPTIKDDSDIIVKVDKVRSRICMGTKLTARRQRCVAGKLYPSVDHVSSSNTIDNTASCMFSVVTSHLALALSWVTSSPDMSTRLAQQSRQSRLEIELSHHSQPLAENASIASVDSPPDAQSASSLAQSTWMVHRHSTFVYRPQMGPS